LPQEAIFVLHRDTLSLSGAALVLLHPIDLLPANAHEVRRITRLL